MKHTASALILAIVIGLTGCANTGGLTSASLATSGQQRMAALTQAILKRGGSALELFFLEVPSASDAIADYLSVGLIKAGSSSNTMDTLLTLLQKAPGVQIAVFGASDAVTAASVVRQLEVFLFNVARARATFARMSLAFAVQMNGFGLSLCVAM